MRYASIDILRTYAIFLMVLVHFLENLAGSSWTPAGFGAPLFAFFVGVSYRLWLNSQENKGQKEETISKITIRRGLFLFVLGFAFNILVWLPEDTFNWDVLTMIGSAMILMNFLRRLPLVVSVMVIVMIFITAPLLRTTVGYDTYWTKGYFECDHTLGDVLIGYFITGYFPLFPWVLYPISGFVMATWLFNPHRTAPPSLRRPAILGLSFVAVSMVIRALRMIIPERVPIEIANWTMFPASVEYTSATLGIALFLFSLGHEYIDRRQRLAKYKRLLSITGTFSKYSLTMYLLHHVLHLWPLWITTLCLGHEDATHLWRNAMPVYLSSILTFLAIIVCYFILYLIDRLKVPALESWMRWLCD